MFPHTDFFKRNLLRNKLKINFLVMMEKMIEGSEPVPSPPPAYIFSSLRALDVWRGVTLDINYVPGEDAQKK